MRRLFTLSNALGVFAFASCAEGFGRVVINVMAIDEPVIPGKVLSLTEIVVDGTTGLLVEPDNPSGRRNNVG